MSETAQSYDSYMDTLLAILDEFKPAKVFEYGTGKSTKVLAMYPGVKLLVSVEHSAEWYQKSIQGELSNLFIIFEPDHSKYVRLIDGTFYDLVFVDGIDRPDCLKQAKLNLSTDGIVMLHDAKRSEYIEAIKLYKFQVWTDDGHTVTLTDNAHVHSRLVNRLSSVQNFIGVKG